MADRFDSDKAQALLKEYVEEELQRGSAERTVGNSRQFMKRYFEYLEEFDLSPYYISLKEAQGFQSWIIEKGTIKGGNYTNAGIHNFMCAVLSFYGFLKRRKLVLFNPFQDVQKVRVERKVPRNILHKNDMDKLLDFLARYDQETSVPLKKNLYRTHVAAELMYSTGMRIAAVAALKVQDIDWERGIINVVRAKGGKSRLVILNDYARDVLRAYLDIRSFLLEKRCLKSETLFGLSKKRLEIIVNETLDYAAKKAGVLKITNHSFRHCLGCYFLAAGCDIRYIQMLLGHEKIGTTEIYTKVEKEDLRKVLDAFHPRQLKGRMFDEKT